MATEEPFWQSGTNILMGIVCHFWSSDIPNLVGRTSRHVRHEMVCKHHILAVGCSVWMVIAHVGRLEQLSLFY